mgnify:CR=1 FL=1
MGKENITEFKSGAIRDTTLGKSMMELIPLELLPSEIIDNLTTDYQFKNGERKEIFLPRIFEVLQEIRMGDISHVDDLIINSFNLVGKQYLDILYDLGIHYGAGCEKYGANNFMLGQKLSHIVGSYERHLVKFVEGWKDEAPHERGMLWNVINIKFVTRYYKDDQEICDMLCWYKNNKPNNEFILKNAKKAGE